MSQYLYVTKDGKGRYVLRYVLRNGTGDNQHQKDSHFFERLGWVVVKCFSIPEGRSKEFSDVACTINDFLTEEPKDLKALELRVKAIAGDVTVLV